MVAAAPEHMLIDGKLPRKHLRIATEYVELTKKWIAENNIDAEIYRTYGKRFYSSSQYCLCLFFFYMIHILK